MAAKYARLAEPCYLREGPLRIACKRPILRDMGAQACTNAALRHAPALRATPVSFSHTPIKYITHSALHANGARPRTATLLLPSPSGQRYRYNAVQETAKSVPSLRQSLPRADAGVRGSQRPCRAAQQYQASLGHSFSEITSSKFQHTPSATY